MPLSPAERSAQSRRAALIQAARGRHNTAPGRAAFFAKFLAQIDPDLPEAERIKRANALRKAYYAELLQKALAAHRRRREERARTQAMQIEND
jgi:hypothetical protein